MNSDPTMWKFVFEHPVLSTVILLLPLVLLICIDHVEPLVMRFTRMVQILVRGWPPEHLDADGDRHFPPCDRKRGKKADGEDPA